jgi:hypothetical protein
MFSKIEKFPYKNETSKTVTKILNMLVLTIKIDSKEFLKDVEILNQLQLNLKYCSPI